MAKGDAIPLYILILLFGVLSFFLIRPFISYLILGVLLGFVLYPIYRWFERRMHKNLAAFLILLLALLIIVLPAIYFGGTLISQGTQTYTSFREQDVAVFNESTIAAYINGWTGLDVEGQVVELFASGREFLKNAIPAIITNTGMFLAGLFVMFFVMFFAMRDGQAWFRGAIGVLPLNKKQRTRLGDELVTGMRALLYGHIVTSIIDGILIGLVFYFVGLPNAIFWAFVMIILGIIPILGAPIVYIPAGLIMIWQGNWIGGLILLVLAGGIQGYVDYVLRPKLVSTRSAIHPVFVIIGVLGGLMTMGIVGFLIGPLILSIFATLLSFDYKK